MGKFIMTLGLGMALAAGAGCGTAPHRIESGGTEAVTTLSSIDIRDFDNAAQAMTENLLASGVLERSQRQPAVMALSRIVNDSGQYVDIDLLTKNMRVRLNQSGKVLTTTAIGLGGTSEDPMAKANKDKAEFFEDKPGGNKGPEYDYSLSGKITAVRASEGRTREVSYVFQLSLSDVRGLAVWEDQKTITKQGTKAGLGF